MIMVYSKNFFQVTSLFVISVFLLTHILVVKMQTDSQSWLHFNTVIAKSFRKKKIKKSNKQLLLCMCIFNI